MKILVYHIGQLGDTIVSIPALRAVRRHFGTSAAIHMLHDLTQRLVTAEMVLEGSGLVDRFIPYRPGGRPKDVVGLWRRLRSERFDAVVSLLPSDRSPRALWRDRTFFRACGIGRSIGFRPYSPAEIRPHDAFGRPLRVASEAILRLRRLEAEGIASHGDLCALPLIPLNRERQMTIDRWLDARRRHPERALVALCPGCKKPANSWPAARFLEIARALLGTGRVELAIAGGPAEVATADFLVNALDGQAIHAAGCFSVMEAAALLARCALLVGLDTGTTHLAAAMGVPCVVVQSANSFPGQWDPLGAGHTVIRARGTCEGCLLPDCPVEDHPCMREIETARVWESIEAALAGSRDERYARHTHV